MSLNGALNVGRSALAASQAALQVAGNNMANAATEGYHRRSVHLAPIHGETVGRNQFVGRGVELVEIRREVDVALQGRYRDAIGDEQGALIDQRFLSSIERLQGELSDHDLSSLVSTFFNSFSELANNPHDHAVRSLVIQQGQNLANRVADLDGEYNAVLQEIDRELGITVERVNDLLGEIEGLNLDIAQTEAGAAQANALRDQRDLLIDELSQHLEITVIEHGKSVDLLVNSIPIMLAGQSRGVELRTQSVDGELEVSIRVAADGTDVTVNSGSIGALLRQRDDETVRPAAEQLDTFAQQLIFQVNRLHSQGQGQQGFEDVTGTYVVDDATVNLNHEDANLPFTIENGSFFVHVTHQGTGQRTSFRIDVDGDAMSLNDLIDEVNTVVGVPNVTAGQDAERHFTLTADAGWEFSFSDDTSGALAALGVNTFFDGRSANSITVNERLFDDPSLLAAAANHIAGSNDTALAIADLQDAPVDDLGGLSLRRYWQSSVNELAVKTSAANTAAQSAALVREGLYSQIQVASGVSLDEEAINLLTFQRQFQAAARFITVIDETLQTLLSIA